MSGRAPGEETLHTVAGPTLSYNSLPFPPGRVPAFPIKKDTVHLTAAPLPAPAETSYFQVTNSCLDPQCAPGHLDIYVGTSQSAVSGAGDGIWSIEWSPMDCAAAQAAYSASGNQWQGLPTGLAAGRRRLGSWSRSNRKFMLR